MIYTKSHSESWLHITNVRSRGLHLSFLCGSESGCVYVTLRSARHHVICTSPRACRLWCRKKPTWQVRRAAQAAINGLIGPEVERPTLKPPDKVRRPFLPSMWLPSPHPSTALLPPPGCAGGLVWRLTADMFECTLRSPPPVVWPL